MADHTLPSPDLPLLSRRAVIGAGGAALAGMAWMTTPGTATAADTVQTYALDPTIGGTCLAPGCTTCNACQAHGANKLFATIADAEAGRAHPGCACLVVPGISVAQTVFDELFAAGPSADRRTPAIGALLASAPGTIVAPGIVGLLPTVVTVGGVLAIGWVTAARRLADRNG